MTDQVTGAGERHEDQEAVGSPVERPVRPLTQEDVFFLIGVAHGPYLDKLTELPSGLLEVAEKISSTLNDRAMVHRCRELAERLNLDRAA
jgi:hypothetical protein